MCVKDRPSTIWSSFSFNSIVNLNTKCRDTYGLVVKKVKRIVRFEKQFYFMRLKIVIFVALKLQNNCPVARFTERLITYLSPKTYLTTHLRPKTCLILKICIKTCHKSILVVN